jgi:hypothetical protein
MTETDGRPPDFIILGAATAGTTASWSDLAEQLREHVATHDAALAAWLGRPLPCR